MKTTTCRRSLAALTISGLALVAPRLLAQAVGHPDFQGIWSGVFTTQDNEFWGVEDYACFVGCPPTGYEYLRALLDDPANDARPVDELIDEMRGHVRAHLASKFTPVGLELQSAAGVAEDTVFDCQPYGFVRQTTNPLPLEIREEGDTLVFAYEEWNGVRTIYMNGSVPPLELKGTLFGRSVGRYEGDVLVIETTDVGPDIFYSFMSGGGYSDQLRGVERYTLANGGRQLDLELTITDPVMLKEPVVFTKTWIATPELELLVDSCEDVPGRP